MILRVCISLSGWLIHLTLFMSVLFPLIVTLLMFGKAGKLGGQAQVYADAQFSLEAPDDGSLTNAVADLAGVSSALASLGQKEYENLGIFWACVTCLVFLIIMAILDKVELAIAILAEAATAIKKMPLILLFPVIPVVVTQQKESFRV